MQILQVRWSFSLRFSSSRSKFGSARSLFFSSFPTLPCWVADGPASHSICWLYFEEKRFAAKINHNNSVKRTQVMLYICSLYVVYFWSWNNLQIRLIYCYKINLIVCICMWKLFFNTWLWRWMLIQKSFQPIVDDFYACTKGVQLYFDAFTSRNKVTYELPKWNSFLEIWDYF